MSHHDRGVPFEETALLRALFDRLRVTGVGVDARDYRAHLLTGVRPIINLAAALETPTQVQTATTTSGTGQLAVHTVPRLTRQNFYVIFLNQTSGDRNIDELQLLDPDGSKVILEQFSAASTRLYTASVRIPLDPGWQIAVKVTGGTTEGNYDMLAFAMEEPAL